MFLRLGNWQWSRARDSKAIQLSRKDDDRPLMRIRLPAILRSEQHDEVIGSER